MFQFLLLGNILVDVSVELFVTTDSFVLAGIVEKAPPLNELFHGNFQF